ncbi:hypothetical protein [Leptospira neocaledonica]|uniref:DUF1566 domain-containing protein n=1 Tax=Leptospira neocaledonica TaxID=2023192 RepID=A0A2M9ZTC9_9LEPT|nr:hypothetical protein [Leptospira neocaledonica]PJZ75265.1 hypothetical protein CH365_19790 [Leptospira neocaledonica]
MFEIMRKKVKLLIALTVFIAVLLSSFYIYYLKSRNPYGPQNEVGLHWSAYQGVLELYEAENRCSSLQMRLPSKAELLDLYNSGAYWINESCEAYKSIKWTFDPGQYCNYWSRSPSENWTYGVRMKPDPTLSLNEENLVGSYVYFSKLDVRCVE